MKSPWKTLLALTLFFGSVFMPMDAHAEDYSDTAYWNGLCAGGKPLNDNEKAACTGYLQYMAGQNDSLKQQLLEIESKQAEIAKNIRYYADQVRGYQAQADALNGEIASLNGQISVLEKEIAEAQAEIEQKQKDIDATQEKIKQRMVSAQGTMRFNQFLDIMMGAKTFDDFIRIANGVKDITDYDERTMDSLAEDIEQLNAAKIKLEADKEALDAAKKEVVDKQNSILALKYQVQLIENELRNQFAELEAQGNRVAANIDAIQSTMRGIAEQLNAVINSNGWNHPVPGSVWSAGTWYYASGGVHLGEDFAAPKGTTIVAVGNGVILHSADGCGDGGYGNWCSGSPSGSTGGGNQIYLLTKINGGLYAVKYLHMLAGTPIKAGSIVMAGDYVGQVGSSGNSGGAHCHVEVFYLGSAENFSNYAQSWNGDLAFGCGWGSGALSRLCENGVGAPCRVKPESVFGS